MCNIPCALAVQATGQDLLAHVQAGTNGRSHTDGPGRAAAPASALHGLLGIRPELLAGGDMRPQGRKKKLNESELWEVNQLKKSGVLTVEEQPDFDDEHGFVRAAPPHPCHVNVLYMPAEMPLFVMNGGRCRRGSAAGTCVSIKACQGVEHLCCKLGGTMVPQAVLTAHASPTDYRESRRTPRGLRCAGRAA